MEIKIIMVLQEVRHQLINYCFIMIIMIIILIVIIIIIFITIMIIIIKCAFPK